MDDIVCATVENAKFSIKFGTSLSFCDKGQILKTIEISIYKSKNNNVYFLFAKMSTDLSQIRRNEV